MNRRFDLRARWNTAWQGLDLVVLRNDAEIDRVHAPDIARIVFVQPAQAQGAAEIGFALVELADESIVFPAATGLARRVHFERQTFWAARACIHWADAVSARLPPCCLQRRGFVLARREPCYLRLPRADLAPWVEGWMIEGPQSWEERRWRRIERAPPFSRLGTDTQPGFSARGVDPLP